MPHRYLQIKFSPDQELYKALRNLIGFFPRNIELYKLAFCHRSAAEEVKEGIKKSNERLEFLGDAILGAVIADYLFKKFPFKDEGFLTKLRSRVVSRANNNRMALKLGLDKFIKANVGQLHLSRSAYGDALEALVGAIYLDRGYNKASDFILNRLVKIHVDLDDLEANDTDFKSQVVAWAQREKKNLKFELAGEETTGHRKQYHVKLVIEGEEVSEGKGFSKKEAEQTAAEKALAGFLSPD